VTNVETVLNYTPLSDQAEPQPQEQRKVGGGSMEETESDKAKPPAEGYWSERVFTISPDDNTSQALWDAFHSGKVMLSLSYSFAAQGILPEEEKPVVEGNVKIPEDVVKPPKEAEKPKPGSHPVLADTIAVLVDASKYPDRFQKVDIVESIPPAYAMLSVYCYDFNNQLRPDLDRKTIEVQASSVTGKPVVVSATFSSSRPDIYSATLRFPFAVYISRPYRYRLREVSSDGTIKTKPWRDGKPWSVMLDITSPPDERPQAPEEQNEPNEGDTG
jgi:hypothetical protein